MNISRSLDHVDHIDHVDHVDRVDHTGILDNVDHIDHIDHISCVGRCYVLCRMCAVPNNNAKDSTYGTGAAWSCSGCWTLTLLVHA